jgi:hypothetical protein
MLELNNIYARYGAITALRGVSMTVSQGELVWGHGAGKYRQLIAAWCDRGKARSEGSSSSAPSNCRLALHAPGRISSEPDGGEPASRRSPAAKYSRNLVKSLNFSCV